MSVYGGYSGPDGSERGRNGPVASASHAHVAIAVAHPLSVTLWHRVVSASVGTVLTSLLTTPLDVAKTRMQATAAALPQPLVWSPAAKSCQYHPICRQADAAFLRDACVHVTKPRAQPARGTVATMTHLLRTEGPRRLWSGLGASLAMAVPATTLYFAAYDDFKDRLDRRWGGTWAAPWSPLVAGMTGRTLAATLVSPLELVRTKAMHGGGSSWGVVTKLAREVAAGQPVTSLWRGWAPTLWRDVPFSGIYWLGYERLKAALTTAAGLPPQPTFQDTFWVSFLSGTASGATAALLTTPFDVVKTRRQVQLPHEATLSRVATLAAEMGVTVTSRGGAGAITMSGTPSPAAPQPCRIPVRTLDLLAFIAREEGVRGLFTGVGARIAKVAPACAIMISSYELGKAWLAASRGQ